MNFYKIKNRNLRRIAISLYVLTGIPLVEYSYIGLKLMVKSIGPCWNYQG